MLTSQQTNLIDDIAILTDALLAQIPAESVEDVKTELLSKLSTLQGQNKPGIGETIGAGLRVLDDAARISENQKFEQVAAILNESYDVVVNHSGLNIISLFTIIFKSHKIAKSS